MMLIVGNSGGTNIGESLIAAAADLGREALLARAAEAMSRWWFPQAFMWHLGGRRPLHLGAFSSRLVDTCRRDGIEILISTGIAPITAVTLEKLGALGICRVNYSTDDPWNPVHHALWFLKSLSHYDVVFTPRRANIADFRRLGCRSVHYLPFAYDPRHFSPGDDRGDLPALPQVVFVGGADDDRAIFFRKFIRHGVQPVFVGDYWHRYADLAPLSLGHKPAEEIRRLTARAAVNLCLVRRANRDGHVMRSFEAAALGGCMVVEETSEHREIFGPDGECVVYFRTPEEAAARVIALLDRPSERRRLSAAVQERIVGGANTYADRLKTMLAEVDILMAKRTPGA
jgi:spore maturation protein CgeB